MQIQFGESGAAIGKKKQKKQQKKAERAAFEQAAAARAAAEQPSPLHRVGQVLLDQARSPIGRQLIATGVVAVAAALTREATHGPSNPTATPNAQAKDSAAPPPPPPPPSAPTRPDMSAIAGLALSALDQLIHRKTPTDKA